MRSSVPETEREAAEGCEKNWTVKVMERFLPRGQTFRTCRRFREIEGLRKHWGKSRELRWSWEHADVRVCLLDLFWAGATPFPGAASPELSLLLLAISSYPNPSFKVRHEERLQRNKDRHTNASGVGQTGWLGFKASSGHLKATDPRLNT